MDKDILLNEIFSYSCMKNFSEDKFRIIYKQFISDSKDSNQTIIKNDLDILKNSLLNNNVSLTELLLDMNYHKGNCKPYYEQTLNQDPENLFLLQKYLNKDGQTFSKEELTPIIKNFTRSTFRKENLVLFLSFLKNYHQEDDIYAFETLFKQAIKNNNKPLIKEILSTQDNIVINHIDKSISEHFQIFFLLKKQESENFLADKKFSQIENFKALQEMIKDEENKEVLIAEYKNYRYHKNYFSLNKFKDLECVITEYKHTQAFTLHEKLKKCFNENAKSKEIKIFVNMDDFTKEKKLIRVRASEKDDSSDNFLKNIQLEIENFSKNRNSTTKHSNKKTEKKIEEEVITPTVVTIKKRKIMA